MRATRKLLMRRLSQYNGSLIPEVAVYQSALFGVCTVETAPVSYKKRATFCESFILMRSILDTIN